MKTENKQTKEPKLISMGKEYTYEGKKVRILCIDSPSNYPVVAITECGTPHTFTKEGNFFRSREDQCYDLKEYNPWSEVEVDTKVIVKLYEDSNETKSYFSHFEDGKVFVFQQGSTSFSTRWNAISVYSARLA